MNTERLFNVHGTGPDAVGLVGRITTPLARIDANVIDLRQDVMHGLFTVFMVVDLGTSLSTVEEFRSIVARVAEDTSLDLRVDRYVPVPREANRKNLLAVLVGKDRPGIISAVSGLFSKYNVNIELSQMVARENVFLMELLVDTSKAVIPTENLGRTLAERMDEIGTRVMLQTDDVFNNRKRIVVFDMRASFMDADTTGELLAQTGISIDALKKMYAAGSGTAAGVEREDSCLRTGVAALEGLPWTVIQDTIDRVSPTSGTIELMQTLKTFGYRVAIFGDVIDPFLARLASLMGADYAFGRDVPVDDDGRTLTGELPPARPRKERLELAISRIREREGVGEEDVTVVTDAGVRAVFDLKALLAHFNGKTLTKESLPGLLGCFGVPRAVAS
jgi:predicted amino acid-binding ACT domain protein